MSSSSITLKLSSDENKFIKATKKYFIMKAGVSAQEQKCGKATELHKRTETTHMEMVDKFDFDADVDRDKLIMPNESFPRQGAHDLVKVSLKRAHQQNKGKGKDSTVGETLWKACKNLVSTLRNKWIPYVEVKSGDNEQSKLERATQKAFYHKKGNENKTADLAETQLEIPAFRVFCDHPLFKIDVKDDKVIPGSSSSEGLIKENAMNRKAQRKSHKQELTKRALEVTRTKNQAHIDSSNAKKMRAEEIVRHANALKSKNQLDFLKFAKETGMDDDKFDRLTEEATRRFFPTENKKDDNFPNTANLKTSTNTVVIEKKGFY